MTFKDNREFIEALKRTGDVVSVKKEVDWDLEAGAISRRATELSGPAALFEKIKGYPEGYRIFSGPLATWRRLAIALGLPPDTSIKRIHDEVEQREQKPISPVVVKDAPCKENIMRGDKVDLYRLPAPMCHDGDGGRYIGTWCFSVNKDPDSDWTNWGMYRFMIVDQTTLAGAPAPGSHFAMIAHKYLSQNKPMPMALVIGADPLSSMASSAGYRIGENEANYAGALLQQPLELVQCETSELLVPAHSEIVIEGDVLPDAVVPEGPFGEYTGYRTSGYRANLMFRVNAITHRNSPILTMSNLGVPPDDSSVGGAIGVALALKRRLQYHGLPVADVYVSPEGASLLVVASVKSGGSEVAKAVKEAITKRRAWYTKIIVVDDDVDIFNMAEVIHAFAAKCHSYRGVFTSEEPGKGGPVTPAHSYEERNRRYGAVALFDCTWPEDWAADDIPVKSSFNSIYPEELQEEVLKSWKEYGF
ncbi:UbiD family decarboxylase [Chloroflexota bacterium]